MTGVYIYIYIVTHFLSHYLIAIVIGYIKNFGLRINIMKQQSPTNIRMIESRVVRFKIITIF